ncbi:substrate-binding periplasmic protein [Marinobacter mobilis]|uniref:substrate-binding periplasmic protein n=1 Tax=Marinobacter mobilis TaxID=488533 RepID=UPI000B84E741|nr:transporter substrate-binding domain-containing protein [Marinobacter mobilis]
MSTFIRSGRRAILLALVVVALGCVLEVSPARGEVLTMAIPGEGYPPYIITRSTPGVGELEEAPTGIVIEVLKIAAARENIDLEFAEVPELRAQKMLDEGMVDIRAESPHWVERPEGYLWSESIIAVHDVFVFARDVEDVFENDEDLLGADIITHLGYEYPTLQPMFEDGVLIRNDRQTEEFMLTALYHGGLADFAPPKRAAVMDRLVASWIIRREPRYQGQFRFSEREVASAPLHFMVSQKPGHAELVDRINQHIVTLKASGAVEDIAQRMINLPAKPGSR